MKYLFLCLKSWRVFSSETFLLLHQTHIFIDSSIIFSHSEKKKRKTTLIKMQTYCLTLHDSYKAHTLFSGDRMRRRHSSCPQELTLQERISDRNTQQNNSEVRASSPCAPGVWRKESCFPGGWSEAGLYDEALG